MTSTYKTGVTGPESLDGIERGMVVRRGLKARLSAATSLGAVHADVGLLHQRIVILPVHRIDRHADTCRHRDRAVVDKIGRRELTANLLGHRRGAFLAIDFRQHDDELVTAISAGGISGTDTGGQAPRHLPQERIPRSMSELVVDALESIQVEEHQRHPPSLPGAVSHSLIEPVEQQTSIGQTRELIVVRHVTRLRLLAREPQESQLGTQIALHERFDPILRDAQLPLARCKGSLEIFHFGIASHRVRHRRTPLGTGIRAAGKLPAQPQPIDRQK